MCKSLCANRNTYLDRHTPYPPCVCDYSLEVERDFKLNDIESKQLAGFAHVGDLTHILDDDELLAQLNDTPDSDEEEDWVRERKTPHRPPDPPMPEAFLGGGEQRQVYCECELWWCYRECCQHLRRQSRQHHSSCQAVGA